jgi:hypothetical protein
MDILAKLVRRCPRRGRRLRLQAPARVERDEERVRVHLGVNEVEADPDAIAWHGQEECDDQDCEYAEAG